MTDTQSDSAPPSLAQPVQSLRGVGPQLAILLEKLGLRTAADLLFFFPRSYEDFTQLDQVSELQSEQNARLVGTVDDIDQTFTANGKHVLFVLIKQDQTWVRAVWFNQEYLVHKFEIGQQVMVRGKAKLSGGKFQMNHPQVTWIDSDQDITEADCLEPVYPLTEGLSQRQIRRIVADAVDQLASTIQEAIPTALRQQASICDIETAIRRIHTPRDPSEVETARARLVYQELFVLQLAIAIRRHRVRTRNQAPVLELTPKIRSRILTRLPFELTASQQQAWNEVARDMGQSYPMNRLIHGEVGSGKTVVALCAMLTCVAHGYQATLMAPTEILAQQHFQSARELLRNSRVRVALWTGSLKGAQRRETAERIIAGDVDLVIGTQAVVASGLAFHQLGLVVIDEQHKFGVQQRALLKQSNHDPHYLVMTATPIPRTIAMTLFGDLDTSVLQRTTGLGQRVHTYLGHDHTRESWWDFFRKKLTQGRQGFVVAPLVRSNDDADLQSAERMFETLTNGPLADFRVDVLHGQQSAEQKDDAMQKFVTGQTQVIVATGVVEVGINVPNATVMTIESAERFGLSQLHQLRGRVSRGQHPGYVCAFSTDDNPVENERLSAFEKIDNGFELAEIDLQLRGPGNLFSTQQSGFPPLMIADLIHDSEVLAQAQANARALIDEDPELAAPELERLKQLVFARYGEVLKLGDVG